MKNIVVGWIFTFLVAFGIQWAGYCYHRHNIWPTGLNTEFIVTFGIYSAIATIVGAVLLAFLFFVAKVESGIEPLRPTLLNMGITWILMEELSRLSSPQGPQLGSWHWDEFLINLDFLMIAVCLTGLLIGFKAGLMSGNISFKKT